MYQVRNICIRKIYTVYQKPHICIVKFEIYVSGSEIYISGKVILVSQR